MEQICKRQKKQVLVLQTAYFKLFNKMTSSSISPKVQKGGIVLVDPETSAVIKIIPLQYNPETISRTLKVQGVTEGGDRSEAMRLTGPPVETYNIEAEIDATDQLEVVDPTTVVNGLHPILAAFETILYPKSSQLSNNNFLSNLGTLEVLPSEAPLTLFIWSKHRIMPVRITDFSIAEEAFDPNLNPIRAKLTLSLRVLNIDDLGYDHRGGSLYMAYQQNKEQLALKFRSGTLGSLGIENSL